MIDQAIVVAERLGFGVVALSVPAVARMFARLRGRKAERACLPAEVFRAAAAERGIPFAHAVWRGDPQKAVAEARRRFRRIAFLLVEPARAREPHLAGVDLPVFYVDEG
jgi:hypothetical protein